SRQTETGGNAYAELDSNAVITTNPFTLASGTETVALRAKALTGSASNQFSMTLLSGTNYGTSTTLATAVNTSSSWQTFHFTVASFAGQQVKLQVSEFVNNVGVDDVGQQ